MDKRKGFETSVSNPLVSTVQTYQSQHKVKPSQDFSSYL